MLEKLQHDHRLCATCFRFVKSIREPPTDWADEQTDPVQVALEDGGSFEQVGGDLVLDATDCTQEQTTAADAVVGFQHPTEHQEWVVDEVSDDEHQRRYQPRWGCKCGNVSLNARDETIERVENADVVLNLLRTLRLLYREDQLPHPPSKDRLFDALREHGRDWPLAIGHAVYG